MPKAGACYSASNPLDPAGLLVGPALVHPELPKCVGCGGCQEQGAGYTAEAGSCSDPENWEAGDQG